MIDKLIHVCVCVVDLPSHPPAEIILPSFLIATDEVPLLFNVMLYL